jgi:hypothetical protein
MDPLAKSVNNNNKNLSNACFGGVRKVYLFGSAMVLGSIKHLGGIRHWNFSKCLIFNHF